LRLFLKAHSNQRRLDQQYIAPGNRRHHSECLRDFARPTTGKANQL
jgi:hypothetical protein